MKVVALLLIALAIVSSRTYPLFKQCNSAWGSDQLGTSTNTICKAGCLMSSVSMALNAYGKSVGGNTSNPKNLNAWLKTHSGYASGDLFVWGSVSSLGLSYSGKVTADGAKTAVDQGKVVILNVRNGGHWVLATSRSGDTFQVNDPGFDVTSYTASQVVGAGVFNAPSGFLQQAYESINNFWN